MTAFETNLTYFTYMEFSVYVFYWQQYEVLGGQDIELGQHTDAKGQGKPVFGQLRHVLVPFPNVRHRESPAVAKSHELLGQFLRNCFNMIEVVF